MSLTEKQNWNLHILPLPGGQKRENARLSSSDKAKESQKISYQTLTSNISFIHSKSQRKVGIYNMAMLYKYLMYYNYILLTYWGKTIKLLP